MSARLRVTLRGAVQGVGFRPYVYRLARELGIAGWVRNEGPGVVLEAEGVALDDFMTRLTREPPDGARIDDVDTHPVPPLGDGALRIVPSREREALPAVVPDRVTCEACVADVLDPTSRYFEYPFTNCSRCGPRYSIVDRLPYDRPNTAMAGFTMCAACRSEYGDPRDRRFHAQPTACPACGPQLVARARDGRALARGPDALDHAVQCLLAGKLVALKGLGGYQLLADATNPRAVEELRRRKHRPHKPFAVMVADLAAARELSVVDDAEAELLRSPAGPIVLLQARGRRLAAGVHPHHAEIGILLPTTALHHLLARRFGRPLICTSGNAGEEPICTDDDEALARLGAIADTFLAHDRPIRRAVDDSVARVIEGAPQVLRLARGYAPLVLPAPAGTPAPAGMHALAGTPAPVATPASAATPAPAGTPALATGAHWKNAVAVRDEQRVIVGPHVGDLSNTLSIDAMRRQAEDLQRFFAVDPVRVACDRHPDYASTVFAEEQGLPVTSVQHHLAHALAVLFEHGHGSGLAVVWDGAGLGSDGTIWGGEFLRVHTEGGRLADWERVAHLRPFLLPGGDASARHPARALAGLLHELPEHRERVPAPDRALLDARLNTPSCTSAGRLFDGVAALLGHDAEQTYEGMAPSLLERDARRAVREAECATGTASDARRAPHEAQRTAHDARCAAGDEIEAAAVSAPALRGGDGLVLDWAPTLRSLLAGRDASMNVPALAAGFHRALAIGIAEVALRAGDDTVLLTGGCFQNRLLVEQTVGRLERRGLRVLLPRRLPPNDGCLAVGQLVALEESSTRGGRDHVSRHTRTD